MIAQTPRDNQNMKKSSDYAEEIQSFKGFRYGRNIYIYSKMNKVQSKHLWLYGNWNMKKVDM